MKRLLTSALAAAVVVAAGTGGEAQAQDMGRRASAFDLGVYAGGAYTTDWFEINDEGYSPELSSIFGATAAFFFTPTLGVRLHGAYMPQEFPSGENFEPDYGLVTNSYLYDLDLVFRPWIASETAGNLMASTYFFLGGGGYTANIAGQPRYPGCTETLFLRNGVCVSSLPDLASVGQGVVGVGADLFPVGSALALFIEGAVHGYDSPAHVNENAQNATDRITFTPRLVLGLKAMFGNLIPPPPPPPPPPPLPPPPPPPPPAQPVQPQQPQTTPISVCVVQNGALTTVTAQYNRTTGDTTVNGQRFSVAYPATTGYAASATWYINNEPITVNGRRYVKYGLPRVLGVNEVTRVADYMGVPVFAEAGATGATEVLYIPVRPGCEFQPYQVDVKVGGVRGE
jgi:hypothetical protein